MLGETSCSPDCNVNAGCIDINGSDAGVKHCSDDIDRGSPCPLADVIHMVWPDAKITASGEAAV